MSEWILIVVMSWSNPAVSITVMDSKKSCEDSLAWLKKSEKLLFNEGICIEEKK